MTTTIAISSLAGSAGKTTHAVTLAGLLAEGGQSVRLIDADHQANATSALGVNPHAPEPSPGLVEVLKDEMSIADVSQPTVVEGLTLVAGRAELASLALQLERHDYGWGAESRLAAMLADPEATPHADVTIIDCPGAQNILTVSALIAADSVVTTTFPTLKEMAGVEDVKAMVEALRRNYKLKVELAAVIPCAVPPANAGRVYSTAVELLQHHYGDLVTPTVRRSPRVAEAYSWGRPLHQHAPKEPVTDDYRAVLNALVERGALPAGDSAESHAQA